MGVTKICNFYQNYSISSYRWCWHVCSHPRTLFNKDCYGLWGSLEFQKQLYFDQSVNPTINFWKFNKQYFESFAITNEERGPQLIHIRRMMKDLGSSEGFSASIYNLLMLFIMYLNKSFLWKKEYTLIWEQQCHQGQFHN